MFVYVLPALCLPYNEELSVLLLSAHSSLRLQEDCRKGMRRDVLAGGRDKGSLISSNLCKYGALCRSINLPPKRNWCHAFVRDNYAMLWTWKYIVTRATERRLNMPCYVSEEKPVPGMRKCEVTCKEHSLILTASVSLVLAKSSLVYFESL